MFKTIKYVIAWFRIPTGSYCHGCPYWRGSIAPIPIGDREIAYCRYLDQTDLDICYERKDDTITNVKTGEKSTIKEMCDTMDLSFGSLLWDACKECNMKEYIELDDLECEEKNKTILFIKKNLFKIKAFFKDVFIFIKDRHVS